MRRRLAIAVLLLACGGARADCDPTAPFDLPYRVVYGDFTIGNGRMAVLPERPGCALFRLHAQPEASLRGLVSGLTEESHFCFGPEGIRPQNFSHRRGASGDESYALAFDWPASLVRGGRFKQLPLPSDALDPLSVQLRVRDWLCRSVGGDGELPHAPLAVTLVDQKGVRQYVLGIKGEETIEVPAGRFATVRVDRIDASRRSTRFWLAPRHGFVIVRAQQSNGWRPSLRIDLAARPGTAPP